LQLRNYKSITIAELDARLTTATEGKIDATAGTTGFATAIF